ncbi:MAG: hypothetical protein PSV22_01950 [Pseudolabrys sp.]|nr:hypothetical protein [Pseudolabrys sp.]
MIGLHVGKVAFGSARNVARAALVAAALAVVSGEAVAIQCPSGYEPAPFGKNACVKSLPCRPGLVMQGGACVEPPKTVQPRAPAKPAPPAACSVGLVARYMAEVSKQPPSRRPAPGSVVALTENGKACVLQIPVAAAPPAAPSTDSSQASMRTDGTTVYVMDGSGLIVLAVLRTRQSSAPIFMPPSVGGAAKAAESYFMSHLWEASSANLPPGAKSVLLTGIPMPSDLYGNAAVSAAEGAANAAESAVNWVKQNPADASLLALSTAVNIAFPYTSFGSPMIAGAMTVGTAAFVRSLGKDFLTNKSIGQKFQNAANEGSNEAAKSILGDMAGGGISKVLGDSLATAALSQGASQGVSTAYDAVTNRLIAMKDTPKTHPYNSDLVKPASAAVPHSGMRILMPANQ